MKRTSTKGKGSGAPRHAIGIVAQRTGLSPDVLRAWERRYEAVTPGRSERGRRLYSDADIDRLRLLRAATEVGRPISDVVELGDDELEALVAEDRAERHDAPPSRASGDKDASTADTYLQLARAAVEELAPGRLEGVLMRALVAESGESFIDNVAVPLIVWLGDGWQNGSLSVAHEHMASAVLRRVLGFMADSADAPPDAPEIIVATPSGQVHEFGALLVAATVASEGWRPTYLGPDIPAEDIALAARQKGAAWVALSIAIPANGPIRDQLRRLHQLLPRGVGLFVGGAAAEGYADVLAEVGAEQVGSLAQLRGIAREIAGRG